MEERFRLDESFKSSADFLDFHFPRGKVPRGWTPPPNNSHGFSCQEFEPRCAINVLTLGDRCTEANNYDRKLRYPGVMTSKLSNYFNVDVANWNLGLGGGSYDFISRTLMCGLDYLQPDLVIITFPTMTRREFFKYNGRRLRIDASTAEAVNSGMITPADPSSMKYYKIWPLLDSQFDDVVNAIKNFKIIESALVGREIRWGYCFNNYYDWVEQGHGFRDRGWFNQTNYLGFDFDIIDNVSKTDVHPGLESHQMHGERLFDWVVNQYGTEISRDLASKVTPETGAP